VTLTKTDFIRCVYVLLANSKKESINYAVQISYQLLDKTKASVRTKERLLLLLDKLDSGKMTPREFVLTLFKEYPRPSRTPRLYKLRICEG